MTVPRGLLEFLAATNASTCIQSSSINQKHFFLPPACSSPSNASHWSDITGAELAEEMEFPSLHYGAEYRKLAAVLKENFSGSCKCYFQYLDFSWILSFNFVLCVKVLTPHRLKIRDHDVYILYISTTFNEYMCIVDTEQVLVGLNF